MKRFLIAGSLDGEHEALANVRTLAQERKPDAVLFAGRILGIRAASHAEKLKRWEDFFDGLGALGVFTAMVPGADATPLREFQRVAKDAEIEYPNLHVAHATLIQQRHAAISGLGGELTEDVDRLEDRLCYSRASAEFILRGLWLAEQTQKILLLSAPPPGSLGGKDGNRICGDLIDSYHPTLCVVAGETERRGFERIAHTLVVNPGQLCDGSTAWVDRSSRKAEQVEFLGVEGAVPS
jgi:Icc-related predicted phosphoesterase